MPFLRSTSRVGTATVTEVGSASARVRWTVRSWGETDLPSADLLDAVEAQAKLAGVRRRPSSTPWCGAHGHHLPSEFVSGGQTGADSVPFSVYEQLGVHLRGYMPRHFLRGDGEGLPIAIWYGLCEGEGGYSWRDRKNAETSDACCAFLTTLPQTGSGTMSTVSLFVSGEYRFDALEKPAGQDYLVIQDARAAQVSTGRSRPAGNQPGRPAIVFWDIAVDKLDCFAAALRCFLNDHRPQALMFAGPYERTWPGIELLGAELLRKTFQMPAGPHGIR